MKYRAIIFDLDGVICHTDKYHYEAWKVVADKLEIPFNEEINNRLRGVSRMKSLDIILENYNGTLSAEEKLNCTEEKNTIYRELLKKMSASDLSEEVKNTLVSLKEKGLKLVIGSSSKNAVFILNQIGLGNFFDGVSDGNNITNSKPDPEVFNMAANIVSISPEACLVVEDAIAGVEAADRAKMDSCAICDAKKSEKATYKIENFKEILEIVNKLSSK